MIGAYGPLFSAVKFGDAMNKGLTIHTNQCPVKRQWPRLWSHIQNGYIRPNEIVTHRIPLDNIAEGYHIFSSKAGRSCQPELSNPGRTAMTQIPVRVPVHAKPSCGSRQR